MANITVDAAVAANSDRFSSRALVWKTDQIGYAFFVNASADLAYRKSSDGGQTWDAPVTVHTGTVKRFSVWYDQWTPGDAGVVIHIAFHDSAALTVVYNNLDTATDTLGSPVTAGSPSTTDSAATIEYPCEIVKARGGNLYLLYATDSTKATDTHSFYRSTDGGGTFGARSAAALETPSNFWQLDSCLLLPGSEADSNDIWCFYWDKSANAISVKVYDDSANSWAETSVSGSMTRAASNGFMPPWAAAQRPSDNHVFLLAWNETPSSSADLKCFELNGVGSITTRTDVSTNVTDLAGVGIVIDGNSDDIYAYYLFIGAAANDKVSFTKSADDGATWDAPADYSVSAAKVFTGLWGSEVIAVGASGRAGAIWQVNGDNDLLFNYDNSVAIIASSVGLHNLINSGLVNRGLINAGLVA